MSVKYQFRMANSADTDENQFRMANSADTDENQFRMANSADTDVNQFRMANSADTDETAHDEPSHLYLHCLHRYFVLSAGLKGLTIMTLWTYSSGDKFKFILVSFNFPKQKGFIFHANCLYWR